MKLRFILSNKVNPAYVLMNMKGEYTVTYKTEELEIFSKKDLLKLKRDIGKEFTLETNAGVDLHSSEESYLGIKVIKKTFFEMDSLT